MSVYMNARKKRTLGLAGMVVLVIVMVSMSGLTSVAEGPVGQKLDEARANVISNEMVSGGDPVAVGTGPGSVGPVVGSALDQVPDLSESPSTVTSEQGVRTKKLTSANDLVRDKKSGVIDEAKVKQAEESSSNKNNNAIPLVAGDEAVAAAKDDAAKAGTMPHKAATPASGDATEEEDPEPKVHADKIGGDPDAKAVGPTDSDTEKEVFEDAQEEPVGEGEDKVPSFDAAKEYQQILQMSPVVVFSKTYCPYSKKIKQILDKYDITPTPAIVELDLHKNGGDLQKYVGKKTGRFTVPNLIVKGVSRGGCDDISALHDEGALIDEFNSWAGTTVKIEKVEAPSNS